MPKPGDVVTVTVYESAVYSTPYTLTEQDFDEAGDLDNNAIEEAAIEIVDWSAVTVTDREIVVEDGGDHMDQERQVKPPTMVLEGIVIVWEQEGGYASPCVEVGGVCLDDELGNLLGTNCRSPVRYRITVEEIE